MHILFLYRFFPRVLLALYRLIFFFFNDTATTEIYTLSYTLSLHDALPIFPTRRSSDLKQKTAYEMSELQSHSEISYAVFCLKKKNTKNIKTNHIQKNNKQNTTRKK